MKRLMAILAALVLLFTSSIMVVSAHDGDGDLNGNWYHSSVIDGDGDGQYDLSFCFGGTTTDALYVNRAAFAEEIRVNFNLVSAGDNSANGVAHDRGFVSNAQCNNDGSNIEIRQFANMGACSISNGNPVGLFAEAWEINQSGPLGDGGKSHVLVKINNACPWDWNGGTTDAGKASLKSVILHEVGHAWGLGHANGEACPASAQCGSVMWGPGVLGPQHCEWIGQSSDFNSWDAQHVRLRYGGITATFNLFPQFPTCST